MNRLALYVMTAGMLLLIVCVPAADKWQPLQDDDLHEPANPSLQFLQQPVEALGVLAPDGAGNLVNWVTALQSGQVSPRNRVNGNVEQEVLDLDVIMTETLPLPHVIFPHKPHTEWMACAMCHEDIFVSRIGANPIDMGRILNGEDCGVCHGAVSFPLTECDRCHSVLPDNIQLAPPSGGVREPPE